MNKNKMAFAVACCVVCGSAGCESDVDSIEIECNGESLYCENNNLLACVDGVVKTLKECSGDTPVCDDKTHDCIAQPSTSVCVAGTRKCEDNGISECQEDAWVCHQNMRGSRNMQ